METFNVKELLETEILVFENEIKEHKFNLFYVWRCKREIKKIKERINQIDGK